MPSLPRQTTSPSNQWPSYVASCQAFGYSKENITQVNFLRLWRILQIRTEGQCCSLQKYIGAPFFSLALFHLWVHIFGGTLCALVHIWCYVHICGGGRTTSGAFYLVLGTGSLTGLGQLGCSASPSDPSVSVFPVHTITSGPFYVT